MISRPAVMLVNLGSPDAPETPEVRRYLREFLSDERVLDTPWLIRQLVLNLFILPFRPAKSAAAYRTIWTEKGSLLVVISRELQAALQSQVSVSVALAMRYGNPSIGFVLDQLVEQGITDLFLIPLYPHYAMSSYETVVAKVREEVRERAPGMRVTVQLPFYEEPDYIAALVASAQDDLNDGFDHLLFSFHGIPERHIRKGDSSRCHCLQIENCCESPSSVQSMCYRYQTRRTMKAFVSKANVLEGKYSISYQSRLGRDPWLKPYTDFEFERLAQAGVKKLLVICPAFVSDCLETLEEIAERGREIFCHAGGQDFKMIPCLNTHPVWVQVLKKFTDQFLTSLTKSSSDAVVR